LSKLTAVSLTASGTRLGCRSTERSALSNLRSSSDRPNRPNRPSESPGRVINVLVQLCCSNSLSALLFCQRKLENFACVLVGKGVDRAVRSLHHTADAGAHGDALLVPSRVSLTIALDDNPVRRRLPFQPGMASAV